jgi:hypothetical protein
LAENRDASHNGLGGRLTAGVVEEHYLPFGLIELLLVTSLQAFRQEDILKIYEIRYQSHHKLYVLKAKGKYISHSAMLSLMAMCLTLDMHPIGTAVANAIVAGSCTHRAMRFYNIQVKNQFEFDTNKFSSTPSL